MLLASALSARAYSQPESLTQHPRHATFVPAPSPILARVGFEILQAADKRSRPRIRARSQELAPPRHLKSRRALPPPIRPTVYFPESPGNSILCPSRVFLRPSVSFCEATQPLEQARRRITFFEWNDADLGGELLQNRPLLGIQCL